MKTAQYCVAVALVLCVVGAIYLSLRHVALPDASLIDAAIRESEPIQEASDQRPFTAIIRGYTYHLTPRAS